jgi:hypothetical protein
VNVVVEMAKLLLTGSHHGALTDFHLKNDYRVIEFYLLINFKREKPILLLIIRPRAPQHSIFNTIHFPKITIRDKSARQFQDEEVADVSGFWGGAEIAAGLGDAVEGGFTWMG